MTIATIGHYLLTAIVFVVILVVLVGAHELGHYWFARLFKMKVEEFAIGVGKPILWTFAKPKQPLPGEETHAVPFNLRPYPLGGFVRIAGMEPQENGEEVAVEHGFFSKAPWQRIVVLFAGPVFSVLAGMIALLPIYATMGVTRQVNTVEGLLNTGAAYKAGVRPGDKILAVDGQPVKIAFDAIKVIRDSGGKPITFRVQRGPQTFDLEVQPEYQKEATPLLDERMLPTGESKRQYKVGMLFKTETVKVSFNEALLAAYEEPKSALVGMIGLIRNPQRAEQQAGGVVTMVAATSAVVTQGLDRIVWFAALLSISIGFFNLLPIPPLDGGQMLIAFLEMLRGGKRLPLKLQLAIFQTGFFLLITLFVSVLFLDVKRLREMNSASASPQDSRQIITAEPKR